LALNTVVAEFDGSGDISHFGLEFFIDDDGTRTLFTAVARQTDHSDVHLYLNNNYVEYAYSDVTLGDFISFFNALPELSEAGVALVFADGVIVV
jgi:hypothetical protein